MNNMKQREDIHKPPPDYVGGTQSRLIGSEKCILIHTFTITFPYLFI